MATSDDPETGDRDTRRNGGSRPVPDPTALTDQAIAKADKSLRDYIDGKYEVLAERMAGHWRLDDERWAEFKRSDERESRDSKEAVKAAIAAQKEMATAQEKSNREAIDKSERATAETIKTNQELNAAKTDALTKTLDEVKISVNTIASTKLGGTENRNSTYALIGAAAAGAGILGFFLRNLGT